MSDEATKRRSDEGGDRDSSLFPSLLRRFVASSLILICASANRTTAAETNLTDAVRRGEVEQVQIKSQVQRATEELNSIIAELDRNGIGGEDVKMLGRLRDILGDLTSRDMATVINLLRESREAGDVSKVRGQVTQAVVGQDQIIVKLKQVLIEYKRQQDLYELSLRFTELAGRQNLNLKQAKSLVRSLGPSMAVERMTEMQKDSKSLQSADQDAIRDETRLLTAKLAGMTAEADPATAERLRKCLDQARQGRLDELLDLASRSLKGTDLHAAADAERHARDQLYQLATLVAPEEDSATKLRKAAEKLDKAIAEQKVVIGQTQPLATEQPDHDATSFKETYYQVEDRQADNVDLVDRLRDAIGVLAPTAAESLKSSQDKMQDARSSLVSFHRDPALDREHDALTHLEDARKMLDKQIAHADAEKPTGDAMQQTQEMKEKVAQLRAEQEKLNQQTKTSEPRDGSKLAKSQAANTQAARDLQIAAASENKSAADEIAAAAKEMDRSRESLEKGNVADASSPERSAVDHLAQAEKMLDKQLASLEQDKKDLAQLQDAREQVAKLISEQQKVTNDTARQAGTEQSQKKNPSPQDAQKNAKANKDLSQQQTDVGKKTDEARQSLPPAARDAAKPLDSARQDMGDAKSKLDQNNPDSAKNPEQTAIAELDKAKDALDQKISDLQKELGQSPDNAKKLDDLAKQLQQAQDDLNKAQQQMQQTPAQQLAQKQQEIADQLKQQQEQNPGDKNIQDAQDAAKQAAQSLRQNDTKQAATQIQKVQTALNNQNSQPGKDDQKNQSQPGDSKNQANQGQPSQQSQSGRQGQKGDKAGKPGAKGQSQSQSQQANANGQNNPGQQQGNNNAGGKVGQGTAGAPGGGTSHSLSSIAQKETELQQAVEQLAAAANQLQTQEAAEQLGKIASKVTDAAANDRGAMPSSAQQSLQDAQKALNEATADAQANNSNAAQSQAQSAQASISQAQAAVDMARQGLNASRSSPANPNGDSKEPPTSSNGSGSASAKPSNAATDNTAQIGSGDRKNTNGGQTLAGGPRGNVNGNSTYTSLPARDRQAIQQGQKDKYPEEYAPAIEQYLKNLSDQQQ